MVRRSHAGRAARLVGVAALLGLLGAGCSALGDQRATLIVVNQSSQPLCHLYVAPNDASTPGADQLGGQPLNAGESVSFSDIPPGLYNLRADACETGYLAIRYDQELRGEVEWTVIEE